MSSFVKACADGNFDQVISTLKANENGRARLLQLTAEVDEMDECYGFNCLHWTASYRNVECMKYLLTLKEVDIGVEDGCGRTALEIAMLPRLEEMKGFIENDREHQVDSREPLFEIIKMLFQSIEATYGDVKCFRRNFYIVAFAETLLCHRLDFVKRILDCPTVFRYIEDIIWQQAAGSQRVDCMKYLSCRQPGCDLTMKYKHGRQACFTYFSSILTWKYAQPKEEIDFVVELIKLRVESPVDTPEVYFILLDCIRQRLCYNDTGKHYIFLEILKLLLPHHKPRRSEVIIIQKLLCGELHNVYGLVTLILFEGIGKKIDKRQLSQADIYCHLEMLQHLKETFLVDLFSLYLADESLCIEYITETKGVGWTFNKLNSMLKFLDVIGETPNQTLFNFTKCLILNDFNIFLPSPPSPSRRDAQIQFIFLFNILVPLSNLINVPINLLDFTQWKTFRSHFKFGDDNFSDDYFKYGISVRTGVGSLKNLSRIMCNVHNFNESNNCFDDYCRLLRRDSNQVAVVSLKNLSRMSVRKYYFENFTHSEALKKLYSLDIPILLKEFLCYNYAKLKF